MYVCMYLLRALMQMMTRVSRLMDLSPLDANACATLHLTRADGRMTDSFKVQEKFISYCILWRSCGAIPQVWFLGDRVLIWS